MSDIDRFREEQELLDSTRALLRSAARAPRGDRVVAEPPRQSAKAYPRWQSGVPELDAKYGGFYGLTVVGGTEGAGKSMLALGSSLLAAEGGWCVCYFDAENGTRVMSDRFWRWYGQSEGAAAQDRLAGYWNRYAVRPGAQLADIADAAVQSLTIRHHGMLLVLDSLSTLAEFDAETAQESFDSMRQILFWLDTLVRQSHGFVSVLALSELNAAGDLKGRKAAYTASMAVRLSAEEDDSEVVRIRITKSRDGRAGDLGLFVRDWRTGRFNAPKLPEETRGWTQ